MRILKGFMNVIVSFLKLNRVKLLTATKIQSRYSGAQRLVDLSELRFKFIYFFIFRTNFDIKEKEIEKKKTIILYLHSLKYMNI